MPPHHLFILPQNLSRVRVKYVARSILTSYKAKRELTAQVLYSRMTQVLVSSVSRKSSCMRYFVRVHTTYRFQTISCVDTNYVYHYVYWNMIVICKLSYYLPHIKLYLARTIYNLVCTKQLWTRNDLVLIRYPACFLQHHAEHHL